MLQKDYQNLYSYNDINSMNIIVINTLPVPSGQASVNRLLSYSKGLVNLGNEVTVMSSGYMPSSAGPDTIDGVRIYNFGKKISKPLSLFCALCNMTKVLSKSKTDAVILVSNALLLIWPLYFICKIKGIKYLQEKSEYPFSIMKKGMINRLYSKLYINTTYRLFDGLIVMTKPLMNYFKDLVRKDCKLFEMPMTVDVDRFAIEKSSQNRIGDYIAFCGGLTNTNGISNLIEAFSFVEPHYPNLKLLIIGGTSNVKEMDNYQKAVAKYGLKNTVFYGRVDRNDIPDLLTNAKALLLARPSNLQASGGFPTKLGEYLATGNPVVVTAVSDIPLYLNSSNSFIVKPDDNKAFAERIIEILSDETHAANIGKEGQKLAMTVFSAKEQSKNLDYYLRTLIENEIAK